MYRKEKRIPTILALLIIFGGIGGALFFDNALHTTSSSAVQSQIPTDIHFTNITDSSFTVSWLSASPLPGQLKVTNGADNFILFDDLDNDNISRPRNTHAMTVKNLNEDTNYSVKVINGDPRCQISAACPVLNQKTSTKVPIQTTLPPVRGTAVNQTNQPASGALVYIIVGKNLPLSGRVDSSGLWVIPLSILRSTDTLNRFTLSDNDIVQITVELSPTQTAAAVVDVKSIRQNLSVPTMQIGNSYNFIDLISKKDLLAKLNTQNVLGVQNQIPTAIPAAVKNSSRPAAANSLSVIFPSQNGDTTPDTRPRFRGTGFAGKPLLITVNSTPQNGSVTVNTDGTWEWRPVTPLPPGIHHISVQGYDATGKLVTLTRQFFVLKSGESVLGEATASATLTPTVTLTPPTPTTAVVITNGAPTVTPTLIPLPTLTPKPVTPTVFLPSPTTGATIPRTGESQSTVLILTGSLALIALGIKFIVFP